MDFSLLPILILFAIFPLLKVPVSVRNLYADYDFAPKTDLQFDLYLVGKEWLLYFIAVYVILILIIHYRKERITKTIIPGVIAATLLFLSSIFSIDKDIVWNGANELFEPFPVLIAYIILFYGAGFILSSPDNREKKLKLCLRSAIIGSTIISIIGICQFLKGEAAASTLYNPDYAGSYLSLMLPLFILILTSNGRNHKGKSFFLLLPVVLLNILFLLMTGSAAGIAGSIVGTAVGITVLFYGNDKKKKQLILVFGVLSTISIIVFFWINSYEPYEYPGFNLITGGRYAEFTNEDETVYIRRNLGTDEDSFELFDGRGVPIPYRGDPENNTIMAEFPEDSCFSGFHFNPIELKNGERGFVVFCVERQWYLGEDEEGNCHSLNAYGNLVDLTKADTAGIFEGRESFFHGRGYIWDRTLPLLKRFFFTGCGADNFPLVFPQNDIDKILKSGLSYEELVLKPHSLYLQTGIQLGIPALILFICFTSGIAVKLFLSATNEKSDSTERLISAAILASMAGFLTTSLLNDSTICVTPLASAIFGTGWGQHIPGKKKESRNPK